LIVRHLGQQDYELAWRAMRTFTDARDSDTTDEVWLVEHPPVYTMGLKGRDGATRAIEGISIVYTDRGGDMTYHGPGQIVLYPLLDLRRLGLGIKALVNTLEQTVIDYLDEHGILAQRRPGAPGVYVGERKIAALGLRVRNGCCYHGLSLNVAMDLKPFSHIDPCGYEGLEMVQLAELHLAVTPAAAGAALAARLACLLGYNAPVTLPPIELTTLAAQDHE